MDGAATGIPALIKEFENSSATTEGDNGRAGTESRIVAALQGVVQEATGWKFTSVEFQNRILCKSDHFLSSPGHVTRIMKDALDNQKSISGVTKFVKKEAEEPMFAYSEREDLHSNNIAPAYGTGKRFMSWNDRNPTVISKGRIDKKGYSEVTEERAPELASWNKLMANTKSSLYSQTPETELDVLEVKLNKAYDYCFTATASYLNYCSPKKLSPYDDHVAHMQDGKEDRGADEQQNIFREESLAKKCLSIIIQVAIWCAEDSLGPCYVSI